MKNWLAVGLVFLGSACGSSTPQVIEDIQYGPGLSLVARVTDSGGALGESEYSIYYRYNNDEVRFFQGSNPRRFDLDVRDGIIDITFCDGNVDLAQPIFLPGGKSELIHINLIMTCIGRQGTD